MQMFKKAALAAIVLGSMSSFVFAGNTTLTKIPTKVNIEKQHILQEQLDILKTEREYTTDEIRLSEIDNLIMDILQGIAISEGKVLHFANNKSLLKQKLNTSSTSAITSGTTIQDLNPSPGDYIVISTKEEYRPDWANWAGVFQHVVMFNKDLNIIHAPDPKKKSEIISWNQFKLKYPGYQIDRAFIVKWNLNNFDKGDMLNIQNTMLVNKPYPNRLQFLFSKYSYDRFYCSSLVWRAHKQLMNGRNLDDNADEIVFPVELLLTAEAKSKISLVTW